MKRYKALDLKEIRETAGLDFAHFTYQKYQCSCCDGPLDLPARYWRGGKVRKEYFLHNSDALYSYILFTNDDNGSGIVTKNDFIKDQTYISYGNLSEEQMTIVIEMLQSQLGEDYKVIKLEDKYECIKIFNK